ncbi:glycosyltransferase [Croceivirga thetidis]|uniref:Glycosyltransferase family 4 protein n=1 Tax=Croceivirga thetidis TaxID=2721623 RepID=A0ABX1GQ49_9FLAO|nr:glycosyltransferase [Croceivirga thetidis]NKI32019.1 glycosyltransferase family 4 protein [Croceivirga thetidis]
MNIAFVLVPSAVISGSSNGIRSQAITWKNNLELRGHTITEINDWGNYSWEKFDVIHIFGTGMWLYPFVNALRSKNENIIISPIIDSVANPFFYKLSTYLGSSKLRLWSPTFTLKKTLPLTKGAFVRSSYEANYLNTNPEKISTVPLGIGLVPDQPIDLVHKKPFCLHISSLHHERKNVLRLVQASKKFNFDLVLAGNAGSEKQFSKIRKEINGAKNIKVLGFISEEKKIELYREAKVFALPSLNEGVGIVALDAAVMGCEIVLTNIGGPKEYYEGMAELVDPYNVDSIGGAIVRILEGKTKYQPNLRNFVMKNYSQEAIAKKLEEKYIHHIHD